jgi:hypothetical protein
MASALAVTDSSVTILLPEVNGLNYFIGTAGSLWPIHYTTNLLVCKQQFKSRINETDYLVEKS